MGDFQARVRSRILGLRAGEVATYGEIAEEAGFPGAARAVGNLLAASDDLPWWRVVRADGRLGSTKPDEQERLLRGEGLTVHLRRVRPGG